MENVKTTDARIQARDAALRLLNRLTAGVAFAAVAGVGILGLVSAETYPGNSSSTTSTTSTTTTGSTTSTSATTGGLRSTSTPTSSSSGGGVAVSGGS